MVFLALMAAIFYAMLSTLLSMLEYGYTQLWGKPFFPHLHWRKYRLAAEHEQILLRHCRFYRLLPEQKQEIFRSRLFRFMAHKNFSALGELKLNEEMKVLISATAIQLTFGLRRYLLHSIRDFYIFPSVYFSQVTGKYHKGEASSQGVIVFSWADFQEGHALAHDNRNLGFHEFSHALHIEYEKNSKSLDYNFVNYYELWLELLQDEEYMAELEGKNFLRHYAFSNHVEMFAVVTEHFFENPKELKEELPHMYYLLSKMLNQWPHLLPLSAATH